MPRSLAQWKTGDALLAVIFAWAAREQQNDRHISGHAARSIADWPYPAELARALAAAQGRMSG
jgi:hypothetical protein